MTLEQMFIQYQWYTKALHYQESRQTLNYKSIVIWKPASNWLCIYEETAKFTLTFLKNLQKGIYFFFNFLLDMQTHTKKRYLWIDSHWQSKME